MEVRYEKPVKEPIKLVKLGDPEKKVVAYACGVCGIVLPKRLAKTHCAKKFCECGAEIKSKTSWTACDACRNRLDRERLEAKKAKAEKILSLDYEGMVYCEEKSEFYDNIDYAVDDCEEGEEDKYTFWACTSFPLTLPSAEDIINSALEAQEHHEDACNQINGEKELQKFLGGWNEDFGKSVTTYMADESKLIVREKKEEK